MSNKILFPTCFFHDLGYVTPGFRKSVPSQVHPVSTCKDCNLLRFTEKNITLVIRHTVCDKIDFLIVNNDFFIQSTKPRQGNCKDVLKHRTFTCHKSFTSKVSITSFMTVSI